MKQHSVSGRPSPYLNEMLTLADKIQLDEQIVRHQFIQALPSSISPIIASQKELTLKQLDEPADELLPYFNANSANSIQSHARNNDRTSAPGQSYVRDSEIPIGLRPFSVNQRPAISRAHLYFGANARNCKKWCKWPNKQGCKMFPNSRPSSPARSPNKNLN